MHAQHYAELPEKNIHGSQFFLVGGAVDERVHRESDLQRAIATLCGDSICMCSGLKQVLRITQLVDY
eukprot:SAG31_NODE_50_length_30520_cov_89.906712_16_plen_67_part_00